MNVGGVRIELEQETWGARVLVNEKYVASIDVFHSMDKFKDEDDPIKGDTIFVFGSDTDANVFSPCPLLVFVGETLRTYADGVLTKMDTHNGDIVLVTNISDVES